MFYKFVIILLFVLGVVFSQFNMNYSYELKYGIGKQVTQSGSLDYSYFENLLDINTYYGNNIYIYTQLEYSNPPIFGHSKTKIDSIFGNFYIEYLNGKLSLIAGDLYQLYGRGTAFFTMQDQNVDYDNSIRGFDIKYLIKDNIELSILGGSGEYEYRSNPVKSISDRSIQQDVFLGSLLYDSQYGAMELLYTKRKSNLDSDLIKAFFIDSDSKTDIGVELTTRSNYLDYLLSDTFEPDTLISDLYNVNWNIFLGPLDIYVDKSWIYYDKIYGNTIFGSRFYTSIYTEIFNTGITYEYKNYYTPYLIKSISNPPIGYRESNSILASRNSHSINFGNEIGHQIDFNRNLGHISFMGNISVAYRSLIKDLEQNLVLEDKNLFNFLLLEDELSMYKYYPFRQAYIEINGWTLSDKLYFKLGLDNFKEFSMLSSGKNISAVTIPTQFVYKFNNGNSISSYIETQSKIETPQSSDILEIKSQYLSISYNYQSKWILSGFFDREYKNTKSNNWSGLDLTYKFSTETQLSIFYGSQKGGLVCANGICAQQPGFEDGLKITVRSIY